MTTNSSNRLILPIQLIVSVGCTMVMGFLDDEVRSLWDLMRFENIPALVLYTLGFFVVTMVVRVIVMAPDAAEGESRNGVAG